jgi:hypothetical protein
MGAELGSVVARDATSCGDQLERVEALLVSDLVDCLIDPVGESRGGRWIVGRLRLQSKSRSCAIPKIFEGQNPTSGQLSSIELMRLSSLQRGR